MTDHATAPPPGLEAHLWELGTLSEPVSPATMSTSCAERAATISSFRPVIGRSSGYLGGSDKRSRASAHAALRATYARTARGSPSNPSNHWDPLWRAPSRSAGPVPAQDASHAPSDLLVLSCLDEEGPHPGAGPSRVLGRPRPGGRSRPHRASHSRKARPLAALSAREPSVRPRRR